MQHGGNMLALDPLDMCSFYLPIFGLLFCRWERIGGLIATFLYSSR